jgi:hypothetical protein
MLALLGLFILLTVTDVKSAPTIKLGEITVVGRDISTLQQEFFGGSPYDVDLDMGLITDFRHSFR